MKQKTLDEIHEDRWQRRMRLEDRKMKQSHRPYRMFQIEVDQPDNTKSLETYRLKSFLTMEDAQYWQNRMYQLDIDNCIVHSLEG